jgi:hypothetical protein
MARASNVRAGVLLHFFFYASPNKTRGIRKLQASLLSLPVRLASSFPSHHNTAHVHSSCEVAMHADNDKRLRLRDQFRKAIRVRHYSPRTEKTYWYWIRYFIRFRKLRPPSEIPEPEVSVFFGADSLRR